MPRVTRRIRSLAVAVALASALPVPVGVTFSASARPAAATTLTVPVAAMSGNWRATTGSYTGYTVTTTVVLLGRETITGRTSAVTGSAQIRLVDGRERLVSSRFTADLRAATTGRLIYDRQANAIFDTATYPTGTFVLVTPLSLPSAATIARGVAVTLVGNLTMHGVTRRVTVPVRVAGSTTRFTVTGSSAVRLTDYRIPLVAAGGLARADDRATIDFRVVFVR